MHSLYSPSHHNHSLDSRRCHHSSFLPKSLPMLPTSEEEIWHERTFPIQSLAAMWLHVRMWLEQVEDSIFSAAS